MGSIGGRVLGPEGAPVAGVAVMIAESTAPHPDIAQITSETGAFRFDGLSTGSYTLVAHLPGGRRAAARLTLKGEQHVEHDLTPTTA